MSGIAVMLLLVTGGVFPALVLTRSSSLTLPLTVAVLTIAGAVGASIATLTRSSPTRWIVITVVAANIAAVGAVVIRRGAFVPPNVAGALRHTLISLTALASLAAFPPAPLGWDPRSIWWFHATWFLDGSSTVIDGLTNPAMAWSHPTYPPGVPGLIAVLWSGIGGEDLRLAQHLTVLLTSLAFGGLASVLVRSERSWPSFGGAMLMALGAGHFAGGLASYGYVDLLSAALLVLALAVAVSPGDARVAPIASATALGCALVVKNEAAYFALFAMPIAVWLSPFSRRRQAIGSLIALIPLALWQAAVASAGAPADPAFDRSAIPSKLFEGTTYDRLEIAARQFLSTAGLPVASACLALGLVLLAYGRDEWLTLRVPIALTAASLTTAVATPCIYALGEDPIDWWLGTSLERVVTTSTLSAAAALVSMVPAINSLLTRASAQVSIENADSAV